MKILLTGANGFLGKIVTTKLVNEGHNVIALVIPEEDTTYLCTLKNVNILRGDITDSNSIKNVMKKIDIVIHLAALLNNSDENLNMKINYEGTKNIADLAEKNNVKRVIFTSSMTATSNNLNAYGKSKKLAEEYLNTKKFNTIIIRPTLLYGKGGAAFNKLRDMINMLPIFVPVIGNGTSIKQPIYVEDAAEIIKKAATMEINTNKVYQIGGPEQIEFKEYVNKILKIQGKKKKLLHIPRFFIWTILGIVEKITKNLPVTREAVLELETDTKIDSTIIEKDFEIKLISLDEGIKKSL